MTLFIAWVVFPLVLGLLSLGCGLLLAGASGLDLPAALLLPVGFVVISLTTQFAHLSDSTARLGTPAVVVLAVAGLGLSFPWHPTRQLGGLLAAGAGVFAVFAAPIVLAGRATFAGYIKLDDTATYLAMLDRAQHHGYNVTGLPPSTYEAILNTIYVKGYPLGSLLPLGVGQTLVGRDAAWLWQPYIAFLGVILALGLYQLASSLVRSRALRGVVAFVGAQSALLYGYALWGGIKELSTSVVAVLTVALVPLTVERQRPIRAVLPLAASAAALIGVLSVGGAEWLFVPLLAAAVLAYRSVGPVRACVMSSVFAATTALLTIPSFAVSSKFVHQAGAYTSSNEFANLKGRLSWLQVFGIWPNGDFRTAPKSLDVTHVLVAVVALGGAIGLLFALRRRRWEIPLAVLTAILGCVFYVSKGSPWIGAKALASGSPIILAAGIVGAAALFETGRRVEAGVLGGVIVAGMLWSNALQYHTVDLAPSGRLSELATIGHRFAGQGPTLTTEYEPYGVRHFLRNMAAESVAELRRHVIPLRGGGTADKLFTADIDQFQLDGVLFYRTLVLRRSPLSSRPPSVYRLVWSSRFYEVWQRPATPPPILEHLSLGSQFVPAAVPRCSDVLRLARLASAKNGLLATVARPATIVIEADGKVAIPASLGLYGESPETRYLEHEFDTHATFSTTAAGTYGVWVGGTFRTSVKVWVDGRPLGSARNQLNWPNTFVPFGAIRLQPGTHTFRLHYSGSNLRPGSVGLPEFGLGPIAIGIGTADRSVSYVQPSNARSLCGRRLDWIEALKG